VVRDAAVFEGVRPVRQRVAKQVGFVEEDMETLLQFAANRGLARTVILPWIRGTQAIRSQRPHGPRSSRTCRRLDGASWARGTGGRWTSPGWQVSRWPGGGGR